MKLKQLGLIILYRILALRIVVIQNFLGITLIPEELWQTKLIHILRDNFWATSSAGFAIGLFTGISE